MADDGGDESLAHVGHAIHVQLEKIAALTPTLPHELDTFHTWMSIVNECDRFKIWSTSTGLLVPGHGSLDYRVRAADTLSTTFRSFLTDLQENFGEVLALNLPDDLTLQTGDDSVEDDSEGDNDNDDDSVIGILLESIKDIIDRLFRLATKLRSPETRLRSSRVQRFEKLDNGVDLFKCFHTYDLDFVSSLFRNYRRGCKLANDAEHTPSLDQLPHLKVDDDPSSYLIERLALANVVRRRQFAYWAHHRLKLDIHTEAAIAARKASEPTKTVSILPAPVNLQPMNPGDTMTISTATQLLRPIHDFDDLASIASVSEYIPTSVGESGDLVTFPPPPYAATEAKFFECPYCFTSCTKKTLRVRAWQAHLIHDLRPYICTYKGCRTPTQLYDTKVDWIQHEIASHATTWVCPLHPDEVFDDLLAFRMHASDGHVQNAAIERGLQEAVVADSANQAARSCPICTMSALPAAQLYDHIAAHLERLAVFSLPKYAGPSEADDHGRGSNDANGEESSRNSALESNLSFASGPLPILSESALVEETTKSPPPPPPPPVSVEEEEEEEQEETENEEVGVTYFDAKDEEQNYLRAWKKQEKELGRRHISTLESIYSLGVLYYKQSKYEQAEEMFNQALAGREEALGPDHILTIDALYSLGSMYRVQNKDEQADQMHTRALAAYEKTLGPDHAAALRTMDNLASSYEARGKYEKAEQMYTRLLAARERTLGFDDTSTLFTLHRIGILHIRQRKYKDAELMLQQAVELRKKVLGPEHSDTLKSMTNLAKVLEYKGSFEQAEQMHQQTIQLQTKTLGPEHHDTIISMYYLANVLKQEGKFHQAEQMHQQTLELRKRILGPEHPDTLASMKELALVLKFEDKFEQAEQMHQEIIEIQKRVLGPEHLNTIASMSELAMVRRLEGNLEQAEQLYHDIIELQKRVLGLEHPDTWASIRELISVLKLEGKLEQAEQMRKKILALQETAIERWNSGGDLMR